MALSQRTFVRVPPDGAGKYVKAHPSYHLAYNNLITDFVIGDTITGASSGVIGTVNKVLPATGTTGIIAISLDELYRDSSFTLAEDLLVGGVSKASAADTGTVMHVNEVVLVGGNNPYNFQHIDEYGSQQTTFTEGSPQFDAFGRMSVSDRTTIDEHISKRSDLFNDRDYDFINLGTAGTASYDIVGGYVTLEQPTDSGSYSVRSTQRYYKYQAGVASLIMMTVAAGDSGTDNQTKRWGYFDRQNGLFFESSGSDFNVVIRSNISGAPVDTKVSQSLWNTDRLDGSDGVVNLSHMVLDITKNNIYWLDFQWLGAGRVRFGVVAPDGSRIVAHTFQNANSFTVPYMRTADLPVSYEIINYATTAGPRTLKTFADSIMVEGEFQPPYQHYSTETPLKNLTSHTEWMPLMSGRMLTGSVGLDNRSWGVLSEVSWYTSQPAIIQVVRNDVLSGSVWGQTPNAESTFESDSAASGSTGGSILWTKFINGVDQDKLTDIFNFDGELITTRAIISDTPIHYTIRAKLVSGSSPAIIQASVNWQEYR